MTSSSSSETDKVIIFNSQCDDRHADDRHHILHLEETNSTTNGSSAYTSEESSSIASSSFENGINNQRAATTGDAVMDQALSSISTATTASAYHPPYLFCGECTSCDAPPPPLPLCPKKKTKKKRRKKKCNVTSCCDENCTPDVEIASLETTPSVTVDIPDGSAPPTTTTNNVSQFKVKGICCPAEIPAIRTLLLHHARKNLVSDVHVNITTKIVYVTHSPKELPADAIAGLLTDGGFESRVVVDAGAGEKEGAARKRMMMEDVPTLSVNVVMSGVFWVLSMVSFVNEDWENLKYCGVISVFFGLPPIARKAYLTLRRRQFDANCMMLTAAIGALLLGEFDEAASVAFLFSVSEYLEVKATSRARKAMGDICELRPETATLVTTNHDGDEETYEVVPVSRVRVGDVVQVKTGDKIPCDGVVLSGSTIVDESSLTGESRPVSKFSGNDISGGSINVGDSPLLVRATRAEADSALSRLVRLVEQAQSNRSETEKIIDTFAKTYTPVVVTMSIIMLTVPWAFGREVGSYWALNGLILIVVACPCALTISTPVTYAAGLAACAKKGIIVKGGSRLEALGRVKKIVFDKTGTLTTGKFSLVHLSVISPTLSRSDILALLALMEEPSSHPLSHTLVDAAEKENIKVSSLSQKVVDHTVLQGEGITALIDGVRTFVGNERLFRRLELYDALPASTKEMVDVWTQEGGTVGFLGQKSESGEDNGIIAAFCVSDSVRKEAKDVIGTLRSSHYNIDVSMLTGDSSGAAMVIAKKIDLPSEAVQSHLLPEEKLQWVEKCKEELGHNPAIPTPSSCSNCLARKFPNRDLVLVCGDGINDAPALATSDVGVAMGEGAAMAMEISDITLMDSNLNKLVDCLFMGKKVLRTIKENIIFSLLCKLIVIGLTFSGCMTLFLAIASDVGVMLLVTLNGMKLLPASVMEKNRDTKEYDKESDSDGDRITHRWWGCCSCWGKENVNYKEMNIDSEVEEDEINPDGEDVKKDVRKNGWLCFKWGKGDVEYEEVEANIELSSLEQQGPPNVEMV